MTKFSGCKSGSACTIILRGASSQMLAEAERSLHDALAILTSTLKSPLIVYGGGNTEVQMALAVEQAAANTPGKQSLAMTAFAKALLELPKAIADNGGYDAAELLTQLRANIMNGKTKSGLDMKRGVIVDDMTGVRESYVSKKNVVTSAAEAAEMILRVDDIVKAAPRRRDERY